MGPDADSPAYAATDGGVLRSFDRGVTWATTGFVGPAVALALDPRDDQILYVGSQYGVFQSSDAGDSWHGLGHGLSGSAVNALAFDSAGSILYAGTDRGVFDFEFLTTHALPLRPVGNPAAEGSVR